MKTRRLLYFVVACALVFTSCPSPVHVPRPATEGDIEAAVELANEKSQDLLADVSEAITSGDFTELQQFLAEEDQNGELEALLAQYGVTAAGKALSRGFAVGDGPAASDLQDGDTLVFRGDGSTWQNQLMRLIVPGFYHHAGVFDAELAGMGVASVVSATLDSDDNGLCFQTLEELNSASVAAARLRYYSSLPGEVAASIDNYAGRTTNDTTYYAFLHLNLDPVSRFDERLWYCSKVPWRVYWDAYDGASAKVDIEGSNFYDDPDRFEEMKDSYVYQVYLWLLQRILPRRLRGLAEERAEAKLREVLSELVTPDELRSSALVIGLEHWGDTEPPYFLREDVPVAGVAVDPDSVSLAVGETQQLTATVLPPDATKKGVSWSSNDESVAVVDPATGLVTAVGLGMATITVTTDEGAFTDTCFVTVSAALVPVGGVVVTPSSVTLEVGHTQQLFAAVLPLNATNKAVGWSTDAGSVATVDGSGLVSAVGAGAAAITVTTEDGGFTDQSVVTVIAGKGRLSVFVEGSPNEYFDEIAKAHCHLIVVQHGNPPEDPANRVVDQTLPNPSINGSMLFDSVWIDAGVYDVHCWFDVGPDEGALDDGDHSVWQDAVHILPDEYTYVTLEHQVLRGEITLPGPVPVPAGEGWDEIHLWVALVVWDGSDIVDLEDAGVLDVDTSYLGFTYRRLSASASAPAQNPVPFALDITGLRGILATTTYDEGCYLFAFIEQDGNAGYDTGDYYGFYDFYPGPDPEGVGLPNVLRFVDPPSEDLRHYDFGLNVRM